MNQYQNLTRNPFYQLNYFGFIFSHFFPPLICLPLPAQPSLSVAPLLSSPSLISPYRSWPSYLRCSWFNLAGPSRLRQAKGWGDARKLGWGKKPVQWIFYIRNPFPNILTHPYFPSLISPCPFPLQRRGRLSCPASLLPA